MQLSKVRKGRYATARIHFRYIERVMYSYDSHGTEITRLLEEYTELTEHGDVKIQSMKSVTGKPSDVSDPVCDYVHRMHEIERRVKEILPEYESVHRVLSELDGQRREDYHASRLYEVLTCVYLSGTTREKMRGNEIHDLRRELVRLVSRELRKAIRHTDISCIGEYHNSVISVI